MHFIPAVLLLIAAGLSAASAQDAATAPAQDASTAPSEVAPAPVASPTSPSFAMDHGQAADAAAAAEARTAAAKAKAAAIAAGRPLTPSQSTDFAVNRGGIVLVALPRTPEQQKTDTDARGAWQARCRPTVVADHEGLRRTQYAEPDCDLSRFNTAGVQSR
jgi:hypothetical protein